MSAREHVLAVDLGTGGPKVALVSDDGTVVAHAFAPVKLSLLPGGGAEQDPGEWWSAITSASREAVSSSGVAPESIAGVGCTAQWSGTVAVDGSGEPLAPAVIWMDSRGNAHVKKVAGGPAAGYSPRKAARWIRLTGGAPALSGKDPVGHIAFLRAVNPDVYRAAATFLEPVDYLNLKLTGRTVASYDSITLYWATDNRDIGSISYDDTLVSMAGLERATLPELVPSCSVIGTVTGAAAEELGIAPGIPVATGSGDVHSATIGSGAVRDFEFHLYIGTSSWITAHVPFKKTDILHNIASIPAALPGRYMIADEHETAGACLNFLRDNMFLADDALSGGIPAENPFSVFNAMVAATEVGSGGVIFTPWLNGERSPVEDHTLRAGFHNLSLSTSRAQMVRSVYEGVAYNSRWLLEAVDRFVGSRTSSLAFIGGGANSDEWAQIHADVTGRTIRQVADPVLANVRGAGMLTWAALRRMTVDDMARAVPVKATYTPDPATAATYDGIYKEFLEIFKQTKGIYKRLNRF